MRENSTFLKRVLFGRYLLMVAFLSLTLSVVGQSRTITGVVRDAAGQPVIGAAVVVQGTSVGTTTNVDGKYTLAAPATAKAMTFSYVGLQSQTLPISGNVLDVALKEDMTALDEVVVVGYGTVKKRDLTGAVASVSSEVLSKYPVANVEQALQGRLPGVTVVSQDGRPGAEVSIKIRGGGSITQSNDPLYIVDGFPVGSISDIPADIIESIDVLKDASSTAIYGARGANGVIMVTTKGATKEKVSVTYNGYVQIKNASKILDPLDAQDYLRYYWGFTTAYNNTTLLNAFTSYYGLGSTYGNRYNDYSGISSHNYANDILRTALTHSHNVTVTGGSEKTKVMFNTSYINDEGIKINSGLERLSISAKLQQKLLKNLKFDVDLRYTDIDENGAEGDIRNGRGTVFSAAYMYLPIDNPLGGLSSIPGGFGDAAPYVDTNRGTPVDLINDITNVAKRSILRGSAALTWDIVDGLTVRTELGLGRVNSQTNYYQNGLSINDYGVKSVKITKGDGNDVRWATTLNYQVKGLGEVHKLSFLVGNEVLRSVSNSSEMKGRGFPDSFDYSEAVGQINMAKESTILNTIGTAANTLSFFGRANYSLFDRFLFTATFRADGSSKFGPNNRWAYFPAGAFAWRMSDEPFMAGAKSWLDNLKLRLSYGTSGSDNISSSLWKETWVSDNKEVGGVTTSILRPEGLYPNPDLKWETTISRNFGIDFGMWNNRLYGTLDVYWDTTKDLLVRTPYDQTTGYSYRYENIGRTSNKGVEVSLGADIVRKKDFRLSFNTTYNYNKNNIDELNDNVITLYGTQWASTGTSPAQDYTFAVGKSVGVIRAYVSDGFYTPDDFVFSGTNTYTLKPGVADMPTVSSGYGGYPNPFTTVAGQSAFPGAMKLRDADGDGAADIKEFEVSPKHTGGFNITAAYKGFDANLSFNWVLGGHIYNVNALLNTYGDSGKSLGANRLAFVNDSYRYYNVDQTGNIVTVTDPEGLNKLNADARYYSFNVANGVATSDFIQDGSYLRLQNVTLGYTLPSKMTKKIGIQRLRVYFTGSNLLTITGYSGVDPEVNSIPSRTSNTGNNAGKFQTVGLDFGTYPRARTYTFGVNIDF